MPLLVTTKYYRKMKSINPYDLGKNVNNLRAIKIDDLVRKAKNEFKYQFIKSDVDINGRQINLTMSKTRYGGNRFWFICPLCNKKRGIIYSGNLLRCRICVSKNTISKD